MAEYNILKAAGKPDGQDPTMEFESSGGTKMTIAVVDDGIEIRRGSTVVENFASNGGTVTQATSISTGVTLSKRKGQITTVASTLAAGAEAEFTVTNTEVAATDVVVVSTTYAGAGTPVISVKGVAAGSFVIVITNLHAANALDAVLVINFAVIKGVTS